MKKTLLIATLLAMASQSWAAPEVFTWKENGKNRSAILDPDTRATVGKTPAPNLTLQGQEQNIRFYRTDTVRARQLADQQTTLLPVLRQGSDSRAPWLLPAGGVVVQTRDEAALRQWANQQGIPLKSSPVKGYWLLETAPGHAALQVTTQVQQLPGIETASPNWSTTRSKR